jgi:RNA polymerase sigma factor (sigma-70 family)
MSRVRIWRVMTFMKPHPAQMNREAELQLVQRLRLGDADAFDQVHDAFNNRLFSFLARLARRRDVAEDLLEETWLRVVGNAPRLREDTRLGPWLFTIARNLYSSYCRTRMLDTAAVTSLSLWPVLPSAPSPFEATAANQLARRLEFALASLPAKYREALLLVATEGLTPAEAAAVCGVRPEAMRQRLSRARAMLGERLQAAEAGAGVLQEVLP